jgi:CoA transferase family III
MRRREFIALTGGGAAACGVGAAVRRRIRGFRWLADDCCRQRQSVSQIIWCARARFSRRRSRFGDERGASGEPGAADPQIEAAVRRYSTDALGRLLDEAGVPNAPLLSVDQVATHPQTSGLEMLERCEDDDIELVGIPLSFDGERPRAPKPWAAQHDPADVRHRGDSRCEMISRRLSESGATTMF